MNLFDKTLLFIAGLILFPFVFTIVLALGVALALGLALLVPLVIIAAPFVASTELAEKAGVRE